MRNDSTVIFLIVDVMLLIAACKKDSTNALTGKWQENKVRVYQTSQAGLILNDTTYSGKTFTDQDYVQFNPDGTGLMSNSHYYYPAEKGFPTTPPDNLYTLPINFEGTGPRYILASNNNPDRAGLNTGVSFNSGDTIIVSSRHDLLIRYVYNVYLFDPTRTVFDTYYSK